MMCRFSFSDPICHVMEVPLKPGFHMICNGLRSAYDTLIMVGKVELDSTFPTISTVSQTDRRPLVTHRCEKIWFYSHDVMNVRTYVQRTYVHTYARTSVRPFMYANVTSTRNHITGSSLELIQEAILHLTLTRLQHTSLILHINVMVN